MIVWIGAWILSWKVSAFEAATLGWLLEANIHWCHFGCCQSSSVRIIAVSQGDQSFVQETLAAAVALLQETGRGDDGRLHLAVAQPLALVHLHLAIAGPLQSAQLVVLLCKQYKFIRKLFPGRARNRRTFNQMDLGWKRLADLVALMLAAGDRYLMINQKSNQEKRPFRCFSLDFFTIYFKNHTGKQGKRSVSTTMPGKVMSIGLERSSLFYRNCSRFDFTSEHRNMSSNNAPYCEEHESTQRLTELKRLYSVQCCLNSSEGSDERGRHANDFKVSDPNCSIRTPKQRLKHKVKGYPRVKPFFTFFGPSGEESRPLKLQIIFL